jgi:hypothetical protein
LENEWYSSKAAYSLLNGKVSSLERKIVELWNDWWIIKGKDDLILGNILSFTWTDLLSLNINIGIPVYEITSNLKDGFVWVSGDHFKFHFYVRGQQYV